MPYAIVSGFTGASKTTIDVEGVSYDVYQFSSIAGGDITFSSGGDVDYLIVGAGGAGGSGQFGCGGGGSAGDVLPGTFAASPGSYAAVIGAGGTSSYPGVSTSGSDTSIFGLTAYGGGFGSYYDGTAMVPAVNGGGGGSRATTDDMTGADHVTSFKGGNGRRVGTAADQKQGGGGRGAGGDGGNGSSNGVAPLPGLPVLSEITGILTAYGEGGAGANYESSTSSNIGIDRAMPGAGGGGANAGGAGARGGNGGPGLIILRVATPVGDPPLSASVSSTVGISSSSVASVLITGVAASLVGLSLSSQTSVGVEAVLSSDVPISASAQGHVGISAESSSEVGVLVGAQAQVSLDAQASSPVQVSLEATSELEAISGSLAASIPVEVGLSANASNPLSSVVLADLSVALSSQTRVAQSLEASIDVPLAGSSVAEARLSLAFDQPVGFEVIGSAEASIWSELSSEIEVILESALVSGVSLSFDGSVDVLLTSTVTNFIPGSSARRFVTADQSIGSPRLLSSSDQSSLMPGRSSS